MSIPVTLILSKNNASSVLRDDVKQNIKKVISIGDPGESPPRGLDGRDVLRLEFVDTVNRGEKGCPEKKHALKIIDFANKIKDESYDGPILFHCWAGISRSSASAFICNYIWTGDAEKALDIVYNASSRTSPNPLLVLEADGLLGERKLSSALAKRPDGSDFRYPNLLNIQRNS